MLCLDGNCHWVNNPENNRRADNKLNQLRLAKSLGLSVPKTITSNDPKTIKTFARELGSKPMVYKTLCSPFVKETKKTYASVYTTPIELTAEILQATKPVPCLIQEYVDKAYELRITVIGEQVFAVRIFSQDYPSTSVDWRRDQHKIQLRQELIELDSSLRHFCVEIVKRLDLIFGAIDIIITLEDQPVFLEINPNGQWAWIEYTLGAPISDALIDELTREES